MRLRSASLALAALLLAAPPLAGLLRAQDKGTVTLPAPQYEALLDSLERYQKPPAPPVPVAAVSRRIDGSFRKGVFSATLEARFEVLDGEGHVRVPVLDGSASLGEVTLDGKRTSLLREGALYTVGVDQPGVHLLKARFFVGQEQDRFARRLRLQLPEGGPSELRVRVPETGIEPRLTSGALEPARSEAGGTLLVAHLDAGGLFELSWQRQLRHSEGEAVRSSARVDTLLTLGEAMVTGMAVFEIEILEGETDRLDLRLPEQVEVTKVEGPAVLQWHTENAGAGRLTVLLRYLVDDRTRAAVHFQYPVAGDSTPVALQLPLPEDGVEMRGHLGVLASAGMKVEVAGVEGAEQLTLRDLPPRLTELTSSPLLFGFAFSAPPAVQLKLSRQQEVALTTTLIDELQASTVLVADGSEITKLRLRMRNNTRQYLKLTLPAEAVLTHSLIDGNPVRPAIGEPSAGGETLLFPLRQSEKVGAGGSRFHSVQAGETLSDIANFYYGDPTAWPRLLDANNDRLYGPEDVQIGQRLRVPLAADTAVEESSFVIELAYKRHHARLGRLGRRDLQLPALDVDTVRAVWHLYLPQSLEPLRFDGNLTQYSNIRYDPFRRLQQFLRRAMWVRHAWAGGGYQNVLKQRKSLYRSESRRKGGERGVLAAFPLVGERYRFKRVLLGDEQPALRVTYLARSSLPPLRWLTLLVSFLLAGWLVLRPSDRRAWLASGIGLIALLLLAHYILGLHRRILWGVDLALLLAWLRLAARPLLAGLVRRLREPWTWPQALTGRNLLRGFGVMVVLWIALGYPLLLSSLGFAALLVLWLRARSQDGEEVRHA